MKINIFTPLPPSATDIANVNLPICELLSEEADVTIWTPQEYWSPIENKRIRVHPFRADAIAFWQLNDSDVNIFHIGNNREMHEDIFDVARRVPGLVVLHDVNLHEFAAEMYHAGRSATYYEILLRCHGIAALNEAKHALAEGEMAAVLQRWPCSMAPATRATGVITHNSAAAEILRSKTDIPIFYLPLPFADTVWPEPMERTTSTRPYQLVVFGYVGKNRRLEAILRTLAASPMRKAYVLSIYGVFHDPDALQALIIELELDDIVKVEGFVSFDELNTAISRADLVLNLRNPTVGEASGSQLRIWANGAASAVSDHGWYASLPSECVAFIDPENEEEDLGHLLIDLCCRPAHYRRMGLRGLDHVHTAHDPRDYTAKLYKILQTERERRFSAMARSLKGRFEYSLRSETLLADRAAAALFSGSILQA